MNKKILIGLIIVLILVVAGAGCFENKPKKKSGPEYQEATGDQPAETGWLDASDTNGRDGDKIYVELNGAIPVFLNESSIYQIDITINFQDFDDAHSSTDSNSPADEVEVSVDDFNVSGTGTTPCTIPLTIKGNETGGIVEYLPTEFSLRVTGRCFCEITYPKINRPSAINLYTPDQGVAYEVSAAYKYHDYGE